MFCRESSALPLADLVLGHDPRAVVPAECHDLLEHPARQMPAHGREADCRGLGALARLAHVAPRELAQLLEEGLVIGREREDFPRSFRHADHQEGPAGRPPDQRGPDAVRLAVVRQLELGHLEALDVVQGPAGAAEFRREVLLVPQEDGAAHRSRPEQTRDPAVVADPEGVVAAAAVDERNLGLAQRRAQGQLEHLRPLVAVLRLRELGVVERGRAHAGHGVARLPAAHGGTRSKNGVLRECLRVALARHGPFDLRHVAEHMLIDARNRVIAHLGRRPRL